MADLSLKIKVDSASAAKGFEELGETSEYAKKRMQDFIDGTKKADIDTFIDKQKMAAVAMQASGRETEGLNVQISAYQREIERLIKAGLNPQDQAIQKLQKEYSGLVEKQEKASQTTESEEKAKRQLAETEKARTAEMDKTAKKTVELLTATSEHERLSISFKQRQSELKEEMERLVKSGIDPQSDAVKKLQKEYKELNEKKIVTVDLAQVAQKSFMAITAAAAAAAAAIAASVHATATAGNEYAKTARIVGMTAEQFQEFKYAAQQSGVAGNALTSSLQKLNKNVGDLKNEQGPLSSLLKQNNSALFEQLKSVQSNEEAFLLLMEAIKDAPSEFDRATLAQAAFGKSGQDLINMALEGADGIAGLRKEAQQFGVISNEAAKNAERYSDAQTRVKASIEGVRNEFAQQFIPIFTRAMNSIAQSITGITEFIRKFDDLPSVLEKVAWGLGALTAALGALIIVNKIKDAFIALNIVMTANPVGLIIAGLAALIVVIIAVIKNWDSLKITIEKGLAYLEYGIKTFCTKANELFQIFISVVKAAFITFIDFIYGNIVRTVGKMLEVFSAVPGVGEHFRKASEAVTSFGDAMGDMAQRSRDAVGETIEASRLERLEAQEALKEKLENKQLELQARRAALDEQKQLDQEEIESEKWKHEQLLEVKKTHNDAVVELEKEKVEQNSGWQTKLKNFEKNVLETRAEALQVFFGGMSKLINAAGKENRAAAIADKVISSAQAAISTALAATKALASGPPPWNYMQMAGVIAAGVAQQMTIAKTPIPSAETGGRFIVPDVWPRRVDGVGLRVNPGEEVNITQRGMASNESFNFNLIVDGTVLAQLVNVKARSGELYTLQLAANY